MKATLPHARTTLRILAALAVTGPLLAATTFHFGLARSLPADQTTVHELPEVRLWFTESPEDGTVSIRLLDGKREPVPTTEVARDPAEGTAFFVRPTGTPVAGTYTVVWRGMGDDGHVVRGEFAFTLAGH